MLEKINVGISGANGKMGHALLDNILDSEKHKLCCAFVSQNNFNNENLKKYNIQDKIFNNPQVFFNNSNKSQLPAVLIDFSRPYATINLLQYCILYKIPMVIGTTGFDANMLEQIHSASSKIPIVLSANMSVSVNILMELVASVTNKLKNYEVEILEAHHRYKKDAPSGTAIQLGKIVAEERGHNFEDVACFTRHGSDLVRHRDEIGYSVIRAANEVGMHEVMFLSDTEQISLKTQITNRNTFAVGALMASEFIVNKQNGIFTMLDVINS